MLHHEKYIWFATQTKLILYYSLQQMKQEISAEQSLEIINNAISKTKDNLQEHSFGFIFWGWLVVLTSLAHYAIVKIHYFPASWLIWPILMGLGAVISMFYYRKKERNKAYSTYLDTHLSNLWQVIFIAFIVAFFISYKCSIPPTPIMLTICGIGTTISGRDMKYKPLIYGGLSFFAFAVLSLYISGAENLLVNAVSIFVGYLIPGHLLSRK